MLNLVSWNLARRHDCWRTLLDTPADIALVQEACAPPADIAVRVQVDAEPWRTDGQGMERAWRTAVVQLNRETQVEHQTAKSIGDAKSRELAVSRIGTLAAAEVRAPGSTDAFTVVSMYASWENPLEKTGSRWIYADASAHRLISDLAVFIGQERGHRIIAAGDLNVLFGYGENGSRYWAARYKTVFDRMEALGLRFVGPQLPHGRQANPWPEELPRDSLNVPTFHSNRQNPATATRQLDFVFASADIADRVTVRALNGPDEWGPSDHCRVLIELR